MQVAVARAPAAAWPRYDRAKGLCAAFGMSVAVLAVYWPARAWFSEYTLRGADYFSLHIRRLRFAQDALFGPDPHLPGWYPRELLGTPFWSNLQSFPFIPTRLLLLPVDPFQAFLLAVNVAAVLAALFTYVYCRRLGLTPLAAAAAGWTFACAGFFAARVLVGHLPLLEAYPALPLLLWLAESARAAPDRVRLRRWLLALALATACVMLAGHPQLPAYAVGTTVLYVLYRTRDRRGLTIIASIGLGIGAAGFALWPMWRLVERSTKLLPLAAADNNIPFAYHRLGAFLFPWKDGWAPSVERLPLTPFAGPTLAYFWDTVCYVGWLPLVAGAFLLVRLVRERRLPGAPWLFFLVVGAGALLLALPIGQYLGRDALGTLLRSPSRQLYLTTFALALALGVAVDIVTRSGVLARRRWAWGIVALALTAHGLDLWIHDRAFITLVPGPFSSLLARPSGVPPGDWRVSVDRSHLTPFAWGYDDAGYFDSLALARPYRGLLDLAGAPDGHNTERIDGAELNARALAYAGVGVLLTKHQRADLIERPPILPGMRSYVVPDPAPRAAFVPLPAAQFLSRGEIRARLRAQDLDLRRSILLPADAPRAEAAGRPSSATSSAVAYERRSADEIVVSVSSGEPGFVRILEAFDPGWTASVNGRLLEILPAEDLVIALPVPAGRHDIRLRFATPGAWTGAAISIASLALLAALVLSPLEFPLPRRRGEGQGEEEASVRYIR